MHVTCMQCLRSLPSRPGRHLHGSVSHVCRWEGRRVIERLRAHPIWVSPEEQEANLLEMDLPVSHEEFPDLGGGMATDVDWRSS